MRRLTICLTLFSLSAVPAGVHAANCEKAEAAVIKATANLREVRASCATDRKACEWVYLAEERLEWAKRQKERNCK